MSTESPAIAIDQFDPAYEIKRVTDEAAYLRKLRKKRTLFRLVGEFYLGKRVKLVYFRQWLKQINLPPKPQILEVGSGDGLFSFVTAAEMPDAQVVGLELNAIEARACQHIAESEGLTNLHFKPGLLANYDWRNTCDLIFCLDVLEHIQDDVAALREMYSALKPGGTLLVHVPSRFYLDTDNQLHTVPDDQAWRINPGHVRHGYTPAELRTTIESAGFRITEIRPTQGQPIAKAWRLYNRFEHPAFARLAILPLIDRYIRQDRRHPCTHGNTLWTFASRPSDL